MIVRTRPLEAVVVGLAAAALAGVAWWAAVALTEQLFVYAAILVGLLVGQGVLIGARKGGVVPAVLAAVFTLGALLVAQYFIERSLAISKQGAQDLPLWLGFSTAVDVVRTSVDGDRKVAVFWLLSVAAAAFGAGASSRRPVF